MPTKVKFILTEATVLSAAVARRNGSVVPLPDQADVNTPRAVKLLKSMLAAGLLEERLTSVAKYAWRSDPDGQHYLLRATKLGRTGTGEGVQATDATPADVFAPAPGDCARAPRGKLGQVLLAVRSCSGASIGDLIALTGWQPHTVRASLTRLRQTGVPIQLTGDESGKRYMAVQAAEAAAR